jgi:succinoglycan biosynthesis protein ExoO
LPSILIVTRHTPLPWEDGAGAYLHDLASYLAGNGFRVEILWLAPHDHLRWQKVWRLPDTFAACVRLRLPGALRWGRRYFFPGMLWNPWRARVLHRVRQVLAATGIAAPRRPTAVATPVPRPWMSPPSPEESALVAQRVGQLRPAIVIVSYAWMCPLFTHPGLQSIKSVCLTHDVAWQRARQVAAAGPGGSPTVTREVEAAWIQSAGTLIAISQADAAELSSLAPSAAVLVCPKACDPHSPVLPDADLAAHRVLFVGSGNLFNAGGLDWFLREIWPAVQAAVPGARLDVCGSVDRAVSFRPAGVAFHGNVPDLGPFYRTATVVIVPLLYASGLNIKLIDAAAAGRAIVASDVVLTGAPFLRDAVYAAGSAVGFATALQLLLTDGVANAIAAAAALAAVRTHLSPAACYGPLAAHLRSAT